MRVSIVIPVYNGANYLREAIDSALAQTYDDVEVIVVNDGSTDGGATDAAARSYGDRIRYFSKPNGGVSSALNAGIREMTGDWFCWLSHDDMYYPEKSALQVQYLRENPDVRVVCCNFERVDAAGKFLNEESMPAGVLRTGFDYHRAWVHISTMLIPRDLFEKTGMFDEADRTSQDTQMCFRVLEHEPIHRFPVVLVKSRQHRESATHTSPHIVPNRERIFAIFAARYEPEFWDPTATTPERRARTMLFMADHAARYGARNARLFVSRAWREWPSLRNPALFRALIGPRRYVRWREGVRPLLRRLRKFGASSLRSG